MFCYNYDSLFFNLPEFPHFFQMYTFCLIIITLSYITYVRIVTFYDFFLKVGYVIISKTLSRGRVP